MFCGDSSGDCRVIPIVTASEMKYADVMSGIPEDELIRRAAWQIANSAQNMLGGCYGRQIVVVAGPGNNGNDGRVAADILRYRGAHVDVIAIGSRQSIDDCDLVIDAAFGIGFHGGYHAPSTNAPVLSVDIPSGVQCDTGTAAPNAVVAHRTITFAAYKPGHFLDEGVSHCGDIDVFDIGISISKNSMWYFSLEDAEKVLPKVNPRAHKWNAPVTVAAGSPSMMGAAQLVALGAMRSGAGMVHVLSTGNQTYFPDVFEAIYQPSSQATFVQDVQRDCERSRALVIGPGLGRDAAMLASVREIIATTDVPIVIDGDALFALQETKQYAALLVSRQAPTILTPHAGEFARFGIEGDTLSVLRDLARQCRAIVVLKGPTSLIADELGSIRFVREGDARLATAGTGDVLAGIVGALLAQGVNPFNAASAACCLHGAAAMRGRSRGFMASDLPPLVADTLAEMNSIRKGSK